MIPHNLSLSNRLWSFIALLVIAGTFLQGCASSTPAKLDPEKMADFAMPSPGKAKLIFFRPNKDLEMDINVHDGKALAARLLGETYGVYECQSGPHTFSASFGNLDIVNAELLPDRIYYVRAVLVPQMWTPAWVKMKPVHPGSGDDWQEMREAVSRLKKRVVTPESAAHDMKGIERYMERFEVYKNKPGAVFERILPEYGQSTPAFPAN